MFVEPGRQDISVYLSGLNCRCGAAAWLGGASGTYTDASGARRPVQKASFRCHFRTANAAAFCTRARVGIGCKLGLGSALDANYGCGQH